MKTITIHGFIRTKRTESYDESLGYCVKDGRRFRFSEYDGATDDGEIIVGATSITYDLPNDFNPSAKEVELLQAQKKKLQAEFSARCTEIERQISQLTAIEFTPGAAA